MGGHKGALRRLAVEPHAAQHGRIPRHHALLAALAAFSIGLIVGGISVYVSEYRVYSMGLEHLRKENMILKNSERAEGTAPREQPQ